MGDVKVGSLPRCNFFGRKLPGDAAGFMLNNLSMVHIFPLGFAEQSPLSTDQSSVDGSVVIWKGGRVDQPWVTADPPAGILKIAKLGLDQLELLLFFKGKMIR